MLKNSKGNMNSLYYWKVRLCLSKDKFNRGDKDGDKDKSKIEKKNVWWENGYSKICMDFKGLKR